MIFLDDLATPLLEVGVNLADTRDLDAGKLGSASQPQTDKRLKATSSLAGRSRRLCLHLKPRSRRA